MPRCGKRGAHWKQVSWCHQSEYNRSEQDVYGQPDIDMKLVLRKVGSEAVTRILDRLHGTPKVAFALAKPAARRVYNGTCQ
jgi:hypothetical protein